MDILDPQQLTLLLAITLIWVLPWKGYALWRASKNDHKKWFIVLFLVNTLAILDIIYIFLIDRRKNKITENQTENY